MRITISKSVSQPVETLQTYPLESCELDGSREPGAGPSECGRQAFGRFDLPHVQEATPVGKHDVEAFVVTDIN